MIIGTGDQAVILCSGISLVFYLYFPLYLKQRRSIIHLIKSLLLPFAGCIILVSVFMEQYDFVFGRVLGLIWLYSAIGTSYWKMKTDFRFSYYNSVFFCYQIGMLIFSISLLINSYSLIGTVATVSILTKVGAYIYLLKLFNAFNYVARNKDNPLIVFSFFTPIISVGLFTAL
jgi:hypothetical protein